MPLHEVQHDGTTHRSPDPLAPQRTAAARFEPGREGESPIGEAINNPPDGADNDRRLIELHLLTCLLRDHVLTAGYEVGELPLNGSPQLRPSR